MGKPGVLLQWSVFWAMARKELIVLMRYPVEFVASFGRVFLIVAIFVLAGRTFDAGRAASSSETGTSGNLTSGLAVYGFILFMFLGDTLWTVGYALRHEQVQGTLEQLYLSPASKLSSLLSRVANTLLWTGLLSLAGCGLMAVMLGHLPLQNPLLGLYLLAMSLAGTFGIGFAFAALTLRLKETAQTLANLLQFVFLVLCANFFPFAALPPALLFISRLIPMAYSVDAFRSALMGFPPGFPELAPFSLEVILVTAFGVLMPLLGSAAYRLAERRARGEGSLSAY